MLMLGIALCKSALHIVRMLRIRTARRCGRQFSHLLGLAISEHETNVELDGIGELVESGLLRSAQFRVSSPPKIPHAVTAHTFCAAARRMTNLIMVFLPMRTSAF